MVQPKILSLGSGLGRLGESICAPLSPEKLASALVSDTRRFVFKPDTIPVWAEPERLTIGLQPPYGNPMALHRARE